MLFGRTESRRLTNAGGSAQWNNISGTPTDLAGYGIVDSKANFNAACSDGTFLFTGDADNYSSWQLNVGVDQANITSGFALEFVGSGAISVSYAAGVVTIGQAAGSDNYVDSLAFAVGTGVLTLGRTGVLSDLTYDLDGRYVIGADVDAAGRIPYGDGAGMLTNNAGLTYASDVFKVSSNESASIIIEADADNAVSEEHNAFLILKQDGGLIQGRMGTMGSVAKYSGAIANAVYIEAQSNVQNNVIQFVTGGTHGGSSGTARMTIESGGDVGIGTTNPSHLLDVNGTFRTTGVATFTGGVSVSSNYIRMNDNIELYFGTATSQSHIYSNGTNTYWNLTSGDLYIQDNGTSDFLFKGDGTAVFHADGNIIGRSDTLTSDRRKKKNIATICPTKALGFVLRARPVTFEWKENRYPGIHSGFIAQEIESELSHLVREVADLKKKDSTYKTMSYSQMVPYNTAAIQALNDKLNRVINQLNLQL